MDRLPEIVPDAKAKTAIYTQSDIKAEALIARMADTLVEPEAELLENTSRHVEADTEVDTLHDNSVEAEVWTLGNRLSDMQFEEPGMVHLRSGGGLGRKENDWSMQRRTQ